ncbi:unnamed protein product, partial [Rotaria sp. Silwood2]
MICLLAPIANEASETDLIRQLRTDVYNALLPETLEELRQMIHIQTVKRPKLPTPFVNGFLHLRLLYFLILTSLLGYDSAKIEEHYQKLRQVKSPALILWGRQDKIYTVSGAEFFRSLLSNSECVIFDDCCHFLAIDKPEETARSILTFFDSNANCQDNINGIEDTHRCRLTTRIYVLSLVALLFLTASIAAFVVRTIENIVSSPSLSEFEHLVRRYPNTLNCPCTNWAIGYDKFVTIDLQYHQVCSSKLIEQAWIESIYIEKNSTFATSDDIRFLLSSFWQVIAALCRVSQQASIDALTAFQEGTLLSPTAATRQLITTQAQAAFGTWLETTRTQLARMIFATQ